jgi:cytoplasmic iron level regulating protein YaaA (DUF328/UPF0246 family)
VLACSSRKVPASGLLPALERYDGVAYRVVKKLRRLGQYPEDVDLLIVSAKYGVIPPDRLIPDYDVQMTPCRAREQANSNGEALKRFFKGRSYAEVFISVGRNYLLALEPFGAWRGTARVTVNKGQIGFQLKGLKGWLLRADQSSPRN